MRMFTCFYAACLWLFVGEGLYALFEGWWPWQRPFWDSTWTGGFLIAVLAAAIITPAAVAFDEKLNKQFEKSS